MLLKKAESRICFFLFNQQEALSASHESLLSTLSKRPCHICMSDLGVKQRTVTTTTTQYTLCTGLFIAMTNGNNGKTLFDIFLCPRVE